MKRRRLAIAGSGTAYYFAAFTFVRCLIEDVWGLVLMLKMKH